MRKGSSFRLIRSVAGRAAAMTTPSTNMAPMLRMAVHCWAERPAEMACFDTTPLNAKRKEASRYMPTPTASVRLALLTGGHPAASRERLRDQSTGA
jgi:hypothetical protein